MLNGRELDEATPALAGPDVRAGWMMDPGYTGAKSGLSLSLLLLHWIGGGSNS